MNKKETRRVEYRDGQYLGTISTYGSNVVASVNLTTSLNLFQSLCSIDFGEADFDSCCHYVRTVVERFANLAFTVEEECSGFKEFKKP